VCTLGHVSPTVTRHVAASLYGTDGLARSPEVAPPIIVQRRDEEVVLEREGSSPPIPPRAALAQPCRVADAVVASA
jgi:hypothetical protein